MPKTDPRKLSEAVEFMESFPDTPIATVARMLEVDRTTLRARLQGRGTKRGGHNTLLSGPEEKALCRYIDRLDTINLAVRSEFITNAANRILAERSAPNDPYSSDLPTVSHNWTTRFVKRHGYSRTLQKNLEANRQGAENLEVINKWFQLLHETIQTHGIPPEDQWNMDEAGFRIGVGKDHMVITKRRRAHYFGLPENRESATAIEGISAAGQALPAFLILSGYNHMWRWYAEEYLDPRAAVTLSPTGYSNDQIG
jgi:hypothetical protein